MRTQDVTDTLDLALAASGFGQVHVVHKPRLLSPFSLILRINCPLRANKRETFDWLKFTLEGVGERTHGYAFEDTAF